MFWANAYLFVSSKKELLIYKWTSLFMGEIDCGGHLGEGYWLAGENNKVRQTLEEALELAECCGYRYWGGRVA